MVTMESLPMTRKEDLKVVDWSMVASQFAREDSFMFSLVILIVLYMNSV